MPFGFGAIGTDFSSSLFLPLEVSISSINRGPSRISPSRFSCRPVASDSGTLTFLGPNFPLEVILGVPMCLDRISEV